MLWTLFLNNCVLAQSPEYDGNCLTQRIDFTDPARTFAMDGLPMMRDIKELDTSRYDATIDYGTKLVKHLPLGGLQLTIQKSENPDRNPDAARVSTTRFIRYGKVRYYTMLIKCGNESPYHSWYRFNLYFNGTEPS
jgi:hypothetical protein